MCMWRSAPSEQKLDIKQYYEEIAFYLTFLLLHVQLFVWMCDLCGLHVPVCLATYDFKPIIDLNIIFVDKNSS